MIVGAKSLLRQEGRRRGRPSPYFTTDVDEAKFGHEGGKKNGATIVRVGAGRARKRRHDWCGLGILLNTQTEWHTSDTGPVCGGYRSEIAG